MLPEDPRHGSNAGHNAGCRCAGCDAAKIRYDKRRRWEFHSTGQRRLVPSYRAVRRIHALQALGYSGRVIAAETGLIRKTLYDISLERSRSTRRAHFEAIAEAYEHLSATVPTGPYVGRTRRYAASKGWLSPLAWDDIDDPAENPMLNFDSSNHETVDPVVVERVLAGHPVPTANHAERQEIVRRCRLQGRNLTTLARLTGWKVDRYYTPGSDPSASVPSDTLGASYEDGQVAS